MPSKLCRYNRCVKRSSALKQRSSKKGKTPVIRAGSLVIKTTRTGRDGKLYIVRKKKGSKPGTGKYWAKAPKKSRTSKK